ALPHLAGSLKTQWKRYRKELRRCQHNFSEKAVHDSRVETRRLLAVTALFSGFLPQRRVEKIERALKQHLDTFDDLRDTHIQLKSVKKMRRQFTVARKFYAYLAKREDRFARRTRKAVKKIKPGRLARLIEDSLDTVDKARRD